MMGWVDVATGAPSALEVAFQCLQHRDIVLVQAKRFTKVVVPVVVPAIELLVLFVLLEVLELAVGAAPILLVLSVLPLPGLHPSEDSRASG